MKILIAEDQSLIREILKISLNKEKFTVYESENGTSAVEIAKEKIPDVILLNLNLPDINGLDICKFIRANNETFHNPYIIVISAIDDNEILKKSFQSGVNEYLKKPFTSEEVIIKIKKAFNIKKTARYSENVLIDKQVNSFYKENNEIPQELTKKEYELSKFFRENINIVCTREKIMKMLWDKKYKGGDRTVDAFVKNIRKKDPIIKKGLKTVTGKGYKLEI